MSRCDSTPPTSPEPTRRTPLRSPALSEQMSPFSRFVSGFSPLGSPSAPFTSVGNWPHSSSPVATPQRGLPSLLRRPDCLSPGGLSSQLLDANSLDSEVRAKAARVDLTPDTVNRMGFGPQLQIPCMADLRRPGRRSPKPVRLAELNSAALELWGAFDSQTSTEAESEKESDMSTPFASVASQDSPTDEKAAESGKAKPQTAPKERRKKSPRPSSLKVASDVVHRIQITPAQVAVPKPQKTSPAARRCRCKKTRCLKLYCDCFSGGFLCQDSCACSDCANRADNSAERESAIKSIRGRNPLAFQTKILSNKHARGCQCKKSNCLKKYCECFQADIRCSATCRCSACENYPGSDKLRSRKLSRSRPTLSESLAKRHRIEGSSVPVS